MLPLIRQDDYSAKLISQWRLTHNELLSAAHDANLYRGIVVIAAFATPFFTSAAFGALASYMVGFVALPVLIRYGLDLAFTADNIDRDNLSADRDVVKKAARRKGQAYFASLPKKSPVDLRRKGPWGPRPPEP
ncbi:MAG: hypothetical protein WAO98_03740 [Alphaproteobacteria bacterium]